MSDQEAFFLPEGDGWRATAHTTGPWDENYQHAGPPAALIGREIEQAVAGEGLRVARILFDIRRPVPVGRLRVTVELPKGGRRVCAALATLHDENEKLLVEARALLMRKQDMNLPDRPAKSVEPPTNPELLEDFCFPFFKTDVGYHTSMQLRIADGDYGSGRATGWLRMRYPLVAGEQPSSLQRVLIAADSGNGISAFLDNRRYGFMNPDLFVSLSREAVGEWVALRAETLPGGDGIGMAESQLFDQQGVIGRGVQSLLFEDLQA